MIWLSRPLRRWVRRRRVLAHVADPHLASGTAAGRSAQRAAPGRTATGHAAGPRPAAGVGRRPALPVSRLRGLTDSLRRDVQHRPRRAVVGVAAGGGLLTAGLGGAVAGLVVAAYLWLGGRTLLGRQAARLRQTRRHRQLDGLAALAADLRAGLPTRSPALSVTAMAPGTDRLDQLTAAAVRLAERTGAPLAELIERIETDARALDRAREAAAAQAAGAGMTAWLLAGLPAGGLALGYGVGVDPLAVLLRTPLGAACALGAVALQVAGLLWTEQLTRTSDGAG